MTWKNLAYICATIVFLLLGVSPVAQASTATTLTLAATSGDAVSVRVSGQPNTSIQLSFLPVGASTLNTIAFGTTDSSGNFSTSISSGGYGIPQGSPVYATVNGVQSVTALWPSYTSSLTLAQYSAAIGVGQTLAISGSGSLILAANGLSSYGTAIVSGSQLSITGLATGSGNVAVCSANAGCASVAVTVGGQGQTQITLSQTSLVLNAGQSQTVYILGGGNASYHITSNSNSSAVSASIGGTSNFVSLFGNNTPGSATITICSLASSNNCATLNVTTLSNTVSSLSFSQNNLSLIPGLTQNVTVSGGSTNSYFISSNSNSGVATANVSGSSVSVMGGTNTGSTVITVCSTAASGVCGSLSVVNNISTTVPSATVLSFSQNVVSVGQSNTSNVTVTGGNGSGYLVSSNSNPNVVTASINGNSNVISLYGNAAGSATVSVCAASASNVCASLYVTVGATSYALSFNQNNTPLSSIKLAAGQVSIVSVAGGGGNSNVIYSNSNANIVTARLISSGTAMILTGGSIAGSAMVTVCPSSSATLDTCASLTIMVGGVTTPVSTTTHATTTPTTNQDTGTARDTVKTSYKFTSLLKVGSVGNEVKQLQQVLKDLGYYKYPTITGRFGAVTKAAVVAFQKKYKLKPYPGHVGVGTRNILNGLAN